MRMLKCMMAPAIKIFIMFTLICGVLYSGVITGAAQLLFPYQANSSIIEINGKRYGSEVIGQPYADNGHLWGRIMNPDVSSYTDTDGKPLLYAEPSNISPASEEFRNRVRERVAKLRAADPEKGNSPIPADLVTASGSGLDPAISPAAAEYQVDRIARTRGISPEAVRYIIQKCTTGRFLGIFGEPVVNVLKVNLMLDGVLS